MSGTSMSCPLVAAIVCLMISSGIKNPIAKMLEIVDDLGTPGWDLRFGHGLPMADKAVSAPDNPIYGPKVVVDASGSTDEDGTVERYSFNMGEGKGWQQGVNPVFEYTYENSGIFEIKVVVMDNQNAPSPIWSQVVEIKTGNVPPTAVVEVRNANA